jgi:hypothetical protein
MTVGPRRTIVPLLGILGIGLLGSCSSPGAATADSGAATTSPSYYSPLNEYLMPPEDGSIPSTEEEWQAKEREVQDLIAACMTEQGFEYIPFVYPGAGGMSLGADADLDQRGWTEKYGYGMSTFDDPGADPAEFEDPNNAVLETMSPAEADAYFKALNGAEFAADLAAEQSAAPLPSGTPVATEPSTAAPSTEPDLGCWGDAQETVYGQGYLGGGEEFRDMWDAMNQLWESTQQDDRLTQVSADWAGCLSDAGHPGFSVPQDAMDDVNSRWSELNGWPDPGTDPTAAAEMTGEPTRPPADAITKFQSEEIALALADYDCQQKVGYQTLFEKVRIEAEEQFVVEHRAELERYRDTLNSGGG